MIETVEKSSLPWLPRVTPKADSKLRLFCFPYAGGTSHIYRGWDSLLAPTIEVCAVELPGRAGRMKEPPGKNIPLLIQSMAAELLPYFDKPFAFYGHSMGALISYELARELRRSYQLQPVHMFVAACFPPQSLRRREHVIYDLPESLFIQEVRHYNGVPKEVLEYSDELMRLMLPLLRADFEACQTYEYIDEPPLACPLTVAGGLQDRKLSRSDLEGWREQTTSTCTVQMLSGDHLFVNTAQIWVLRMLSQTLSAYMQ